MMKVSPQTLEPIKQDLLTIFGDQFSQNIESFDPSGFKLGPQLNSYLSSVHPLARKWGEFCSDIKKSEAAKKMIVGPETIHILQLYIALSAMKDIQNFQERVIDRLVKKAEYYSTYFEVMVAAPLESTGIHFIHTATAKLANTLSGGYFNIAEVDAYSWYVTEMMEEVREFLALHYALTQREDSPFWEHVKYETKLRGMAPSVLSKGHDRFPANQTGYVFQNSSWVCILNGMNHVPMADPFLKIQPEVLAQQMTLVKGMGELRKRLIDHIPTHADYLSRLGSRREMVI